MTDLDRLPVIVGAGQLRNNRDRTLDDAREPRDLLVDALRRAADDAGVGERLLAAADRLDVVSVISWAYDDLPGLVAEGIGARPRITAHSAPGGNKPCELIDDAAAAISRGELDVALVCGAEAAASTAAAAKAGQELPWSRTPGGPVRFPREISGTEYAYRHKLVRPIRAYPLYENRLRADLGQTFADAQDWSARMYADFSEVAAKNPAAWHQEPLRPEDIATVGPGNRMVCYPYPLQMNAFGAVDQASAVVVTSLGTARRFGVPEDHIVHVWGGAGAADSRDILRRGSYGQAPAMAAAFDTIFAAAGIGVDDLDVLDLYSCFPVVPKLASTHLGLDRDRPLTATGGLTAFGGPGNEYSLHAVVSVAERLRDGERLGLVYGNGEFVTKHHVLLLGSEPHASGYVGRSTDIGWTAPEPPPLVETAEGAATVETYTVEFDRDGAPALGFVIGRQADGARFLANAVDPATCAALVSPELEPVGMAGTVRTTPEGRNVFCFD
jgi:acetyl-CoA C-acetyltransferase